MTRSRRRMEMRPPVRAAAASACWPGQRSRPRLGAAALALAVGLGLPAAAAAQPTPETLVKNWFKSFDKSLNWQTGQYHQRFTTGTNEAGYVLTQVAVHAGTTGTHNNYVRFQVCPVGSPPQGAGCTTRQEKTALSSALRFYLHLVLEPNTTYAVLINNGRTNASQLATNDNAEGVALPGWSIGNSIHKWNGHTRTWNPDGAASLRMDVIGHVNTAATGAPAIAGRAHPGETITAQAGSIGDSNGLTGATYEWTWEYADGTPRATGAVLVLEDRDLGKQLILTARFEDDIRAPEVRTTAAWPAGATIVPRTAAPSLTDLTLSDGVLNPPFVAATTRYSARVAASVTQVTLTPTAGDANAAIAYLDGSGQPLGDADESMPDFQVDVGSGRTVVRIRVTAEASTRTRTYEVTLQRNHTRCAAPASGELWCGTLTVGTRGTERGYSQTGGYGSLAPARFVHRGITATVAYLAYNERSQGGLGFKTRTSGSEEPRLGFYGNEDYVLEIGSGGARRSFGIEQPGASKSFDFPDDGLSWTEGEQLIVRLRQSGAQTVPPFVDEPPRISVRYGKRDDAWTPGSMVIVTLSFSAPVYVHAYRGQAPTIDIELGGAAAGRRRAPFRDGNNTRELEFWYTVTEADGTHESIEVLPDSLTLRDGLIFGAVEPSVSARLGHEGAFSGPPAAAGQAAIEPPTVEGAPTLGGAGDNGTWREGETATVTVTLSEPVVVDTAGGTPSIGIELGGTTSRRAAYTGGSGTDTLRFGYTLVAGDGAHTLMGVTADSLTLNGGTIRSAEADTDAVLRISDQVDRRFRWKWITCFGRSGSPISAEVDRFRPKWITRFRG